MGREARCTAWWGTRTGDVSVHLAGGEIAVRGAIRARAPLASLRDVRVTGGALRFRAGDEDVVLLLGAYAERWAKALVTPPPSLAAKLGIRAGTRVAVYGTVDDAALAEALGAGVPADGDGVDVIVARVDDAAELARVIALRAADVRSRVPMWVVYTKGRSAPLGETTVRAMLCARGLVDVKVAAVSSTLTALQFIGAASR